MRLFKVFGLAVVAALATSAPAAARSPALAAVRTIIEAVNEKSADKYASVFASDAVVQIYQGPVRINGRDDLRNNRAAHFKRFPSTRSEIVHLVEIGNTVVMHDRLWLAGDAETPADIVEIYTFDNGLITRVDVIQQQDLSNRIAAPREQ